MISNNCQWRGFAKRIKAHGFQAETDTPRKCPAPLPLQRCCGYWRKPAVAVFQHPVHCVYRLERSFQTAKPLLSRNCWRVGAITKVCQRCRALPIIPPSTRTHSVGAMMVDCGVHQVLLSCARMFELRSALLSRLAACVRECSKPTLNASLKVNGPPLIASPASPVSTTTSATTEASYLASLPVHFRLCVQLFFKLLDSLQSHALSKSGNGSSHGVSGSSKYAGILRVVSQLPGILAQFPALSMAAERRFHINSSTSPFAPSDGSGDAPPSAPFVGITGVLQAGLLRIYSQMVEDSTASSGDDKLAGVSIARAVVLASLYGLAVRQGSLPNLLHVADLLLELGADCASHTDAAEECNCDSGAVAMMKPFLGELEGSRAIRRAVLTPQCTSSSLTPCTPPGSAPRGSIQVHGGFPTIPGLVHVCCASLPSFLRPSLVTIPLRCVREPLQDVVGASLFSSHAALLTRSGTVFTWGNAANGRLGHSAPSLLSSGDRHGDDDDLTASGKDARLSTVDKVAVVSAPTLVSGLPEKVRATSCCCCP